MNHVNVKLINALNKTQYYEFIREALGIQAFLSRSGLQIRTIDNDLYGNKKTSKQKDQPRVLAYEYFAGKRVNTYLAYSEDYLEKTYRDKSENVYSVFECFADVKDDIICLILVGVIGLESLNGDLLIPNGIDGMDIFRTKSIDNFDFILGAGVDFDFNLGSWDQLLETMKNEVRRIKGIPAPNASMDELGDFEKSICNTNYVTPQLYKDIDINGYYKSLYDYLYNKFTPNSTDKAVTPSVEDTNLYQIARIATERMTECNILSFNYDNILEMILFNNFPKATYKSTYKHSRKQMADIDIIHAHGYFPYNPIGVSIPHSIVLSTYEYMEGYLKSTKYARNKLALQLRKTNVLIGNSLSDYEEQKVFYSHHKKYKNEYSFIFLVLSVPTVWKEQYLTTYFLSIGVIPVFFKSFQIMNDFLKKL